MIGVVMLFEVFQFCVFFFFFLNVRGTGLYGLKPGHTILLLAEMDADDIVEAAFIL